MSRYKALLKYSLSAARDAPFIVSILSLNAAFIPAKLFGAQT
jgi:hypothetical protein